MSGGLFDFEPLVVSYKTDDSPLWSYTITETPSDEVLYQKEISNALEYLNLFCK